MVDLLRASQGLVPQTRGPLEALDLVQQLGARQQQQDINQQTEQLNQFKLAQAEVGAIGQEANSLLSFETPESLSAGLLSSIKRIKANPVPGLNIEDFLDMAKRLGTPGGFTTVRAELKSDVSRAKDIGTKISAAQQEFESLIADFTPAQQDKAKLIKAGITARQIGSGKITTAETEGLTEKVAKSEGEIAGEIEGAKLGKRFKLQPKIAAAVTLATGKAAAIVDRTKEKRSNTLAFDSYTTAIDNLANSLGGTITGPGAGLTPALTANAQIAEGAVAMMAPVLKGIFRTAGEGIFTDKDQELLLKMVPTRSTLPAARTAQLLAIDALVKAKLRQNETPSAEGEIDLTTLSMEDLLKLQSETQ